MSRALVLGNEAAFEPDLPPSDEAAMLADTGTS